MSFKFGYNSTKCCLCLQNLVEAELSPRLLERKLKETPEIIDDVYLKCQGKDELGLTSVDATKPSSKLATPYCEPNGDGGDRESMVLFLMGFKLELFGLLAIS